MLNAIYTVSPCQVHPLNPPSLSLLLLIMASSRWKRFAFFDKHTLNLPSSVLEDLALDTDRTNAISMQMTTAGLPLNTKIPPKRESSNNEEPLSLQEEEQQQPLSAMWLSLTARSAPSSESLSPNSEQPSTTISLAQSILDVGSKQWMDLY